LSYIKEIKQTVFEMNELVHDLLDVGVINSGNFAVDMSKKINVCDLMTRAVKLNYDYALRRNISLKTEITKDINPINLDSKRLKQILTNLISNSIKYSPKNTEVKISAEIIKEKFLEIKIIDQGFGMTESEIEIAFQKYQTINNPNSGTVDSFGLGLPIVKQLTESMNGKIEMKSEVNVGTEVMLKFPL
jgi:signal transduction histidine kinase